MQRIVTIVVSLRQCAESADCSNALLA